jgi:hypothetical protein
MLKHSHPVEKVYMFVSIAFQFHFRSLIDKHLNSLYEAATTEVSRAEIARAALANVIAWLGWLRALELFSLTWNDLTVLELLGPRWISLMELEPFWLDFCRKPSLAKRSPLMWFWLTPRHLVYRLANGPTVFDRLWAIKPSQRPLNVSSNTRMAPRGRRISSVPLIFGLCCTCSALRAMRI